MGCDNWSKTIHLDGFAAQRKELWVASLWAVAVAFLWTIQWGPVCFASLAGQDLAASCGFIHYHLFRGLANPIFASSLDLSIIPSIPCFHINSQWWWNRWFIASQSQLAIIQYPAVLAVITRCVNKFKAHLIRFILKLLYMLFPNQ